MAERTDYDGGWKEFLEHYLRAFLELCFPRIAREIDWSAGVEFLDKELQEVVRDADLGKQRVDKLVKVRRLDGEEECVLIHVEVQGRHEATLSQRAFQYYHRIGDRFGRRVATLVVLADEHPGWKPTSYEEELWGCRLRFDFPVCKLLELAEDREKLEGSDNPAAVVVLAHLAAQQTRGDMELRRQWKWELTRGLYDRGHQKQDILELFRLIDWFLELPRGLELAFRQELVKFEEEKAMPYVTSIERLGREEGRTEEAVNFVLRLSQKRFGSLSSTDETAIRQLPLPALEALGEALLDFEEIDQLREWLKQNGSD